MVVVVVVEVTSFLLRLKSGLDLLLPFLPVDGRGALLGNVLGVDVVVVVVVVVVLLVVGGRV